MPEIMLVTQIVFQDHTLQPFPPTLKETDAAHDYLVCWKTVKGCFTNHGAIHHLGPAGRTVKLILLEGAA